MEGKLNYEVAEGHRKEIKPKFNNFVSSDIQKRN